MTISPKNFQICYGLLLTCVILTPTSAQAALPESIETALKRAALTSDDISIIITPVGDNKTRRLPSVIQVINNDGENNYENNNSNNNTQATATPSKTNSVSLEQNPLNQNTLTIDQQNIKQQQRQINSLTDDPYTYRSLKSTPSLLSQSQQKSQPSNDTAVDSKTPTQAVQASLLSHQPNIARTPASTMKLIPSFIALDTLGADFVWYTRVYHTGIIINNRLHGDLIIQGSGDPKMTHGRLQELLNRIKQKGVEHIDGNIILDSSIFKNVSKNPAAFDNAPLRPYNASPDGFLVNFNSMGISSQLLENGQAKLTYTPPLANYKLPDIIDTRAAPCSNASYSLAPKWQADELIFNAKLPNSCGEHIFYVGYPDAKDFAARVIKAQWQAMGNTISGDVIAQEHAYDFVSPLIKPKSGRSTATLSTLVISPLPIVSYPSLSLTEQIYDINHFSNNVMTEQLTLSIGAYYKSPLAEGNLANANNATSVADINARGSTYTSAKTSLYHFDYPKSSDYPQALQSINEWWQANLTTPPPYLTNGSGLCRRCTLTAANLDELLGYAYHHPNFSAYVGSLGVVGVSGTIMHHSERLPESSAIGRAWIKTGTLSNVTAMAGYVSAQSGQDYTVVGIINTEQALNPDTARPVLDAMLDWTAQQ